MAASNGVSGAAEARMLKVLEDESARWKRLPDAMLHNAVLKEIASGKRTARTGSPAALTPSA